VNRPNPPPALPKDKEPRDVFNRWLYNQWEYTQHNKFADLQGGTLGEYYHLTAAEHTFVSTIAPGSDSTKFLRGDATWSNTLTGPFTVDGNVTIGNAAADTLTINAGIWNYNNNWIATRAAGTLAAGTTTILRQDITYTGDPGGTTDARTLALNSIAQGANNIANFVMMRAAMNHDGSGLVTTGQGFQYTAGLRSTGNMTNARVFVGQLVIENSGGVTTGECYLAAAPNLGGGSSTGNITTLNGFRAANLGNATRITNSIGYQQDDFTGSGTITVGFRSQMSSGTGKWGFLHTGTANNGFNGNVRIGSTVAPTVALDVTGSVAISSDLTLPAAPSDPILLSQIFGN